MSMLELEERSQVSLDDLPSVDDAVPCEWDSNYPGVVCKDAAEWRVVVRGACPCGEITMLLCPGHERLVRAASKASELACLPHQHRVRWQRSVPL